LHCEWNWDVLTKGEFVRAANISLVSLLRVGREPALSSRMALKTIFIFPRRGRRVREEIEGMATVVTEY
jgi:hypothetical protein